MKYKKKYNKLVRDLIPELLSKKGDEFSFHTANEREYIWKLGDKLVEESNEVDEAVRKISDLLDDPYVNDDDFNNAKDAVIEELADLSEVVKYIKEYFDIQDDAVEQVRLKKREEHGAFDKRFILEWLKI